LPEKRALFAVLTCEACRTHGTNPKHMPKIEGPSLLQKRRKKIYFFVGCLAVSLLITWLINEPGFSDSQTYVLFLSFFSILLWLTEAIPPFAVAFFIMAFLVFALGNPNFNSAPEKIDQYVNTFSSSIIWLLLGGFFLARAMTKTKFDQQILRATLKLSGTKAKSVLAAFMLTAMVISMLMSNTAAAAMLVAAMMPLLANTGKSRISKALLMGISIATATGGMATIIGTPPNAFAAAILEKEGISIDFLGWMLYGLPIAILLTFAGWLVLVRRYLVKAEPVSIDFLESQEDSKLGVSSLERTLVLVVLIITLLLWLTSSLHNITSSAVSAVPIVLFTLTGIITADDVKSMPWDVLILIAGGMSLGVALESTGILEHYAQLIKSYNVNQWVLLFLFCFLVMVLSNVMSNVAACVIILPLGLSLLPDLQKEMAISVALSSSAAILLPVSTPPNAIVYGTGYCDVKDFQLGGLVIGVLGPLLAILWTVILSR